MKASFGSVCVFFVWARQNQREASVRPGYSRVNVGVLLGLADVGDQVGSFVSSNCEGFDCVPNSAVGCCWGWRMPAHYK